MKKSKSPFNTIETIENLYEYHKPNDYSVFHSINNTIPDVFVFDNWSNKMEELCFELKKQFKISDENIITAKKVDLEDSSLNDVCYLIAISKNLIVSLNSSWSESQPAILYARNTDMNLVERIKCFIESKNFASHKSSLNLLTIKHESVCPNKFELEIPDIEIDKNYNNDLKQIHSSIQSSLQKQNEKGLILFYGEPGTGKTTYLRHLIKNVGKKIFFVSPDLAKKLGEPMMLDFLISNKNSILVIEDAEELIKKRETGRTGSISTLLNLSDGLLADCLNIQVICTFNTKISNIDQALLRKGRIIAKYEFNKLDINKTNNLLQSLYPGTVSTEELTLSDIYNYDATSFNDEVTYKKLGFAV